MADLYRKSSLEKISNPEQLDKAIMVSSPMSWLVIAGVAVIFIGVIIWGFIGKIPEQVDTQGFIVDSDSSWPINGDEVEENESEKIDMGDSDFSVICYLKAEDYSKVKCNIGSDDSSSASKVTVTFYDGDRKVSCDGYVADKSYFAADVNDAGTLVSNGISKDSYSCAVLCFCSFDKDDIRPVSVMTGTVTNTKIIIGSTRPVDKLPFINSSSKGEKQ